MRNWFELLRAGFKAASIPVFSHLAWYLAHSGHLANIYWINRKVLQGVVWRGRKGLGSEEDNLRGCPLGALRTGGEGTEG